MSFGRWVGILTKGERNTERERGHVNSSRQSPSLPFTHRNKNKTNPLLSSKHFLFWPLADGSVIPTKSLPLSSQLCFSSAHSSSCAREREELRKNSLAGRNLTTEGWNLSEEILQSGCEDEVVTQSTWHTAGALGVFIE